MKAEAFLERCEKVKSTGRGTWIARCPAHNDKRPSMTVREVDDGRVLVHCFAGCDIGQILGAVGLEFDALFPDKPIEHAKPIRRPFPAHDVLQAVSGEALVVAVSALDVAYRREMSDEEIERMLVAAQRLFEAERIANG